MRRALQRALGMHRGNFTRDYQRAVIRAGGRFTNRKDHALDLINDLFYGHQSTASGSFCLALTLNNFAQIWTSVSNSSGAHIPVYGLATTSIGYVPGDWSITDGLLGASGKALNSNILASDIPQNTGGIFGFGAVRAATNQTLIGAKNSGVATNVSQANSRNATQMQAAYQRSSTSQPAITADNAFIMTSRTESATFQCYAVASGTMTQTNTSATSVANPSATFFYCARNNGDDTPEGSYTQRLLGGGILTTALDTTMVEVLYNAFVTLNTARASL
jgi:hypothetical protein